MHTIQVTDATDTKGEDLNLADLNLSLAQDGSNIWIDRLAAIEEIETVPEIAGFIEGASGLNDSELAEYLILARTCSQSNHPEVAACSVQIIYPAIPR